jgi:hypothetical protein
VGKRDRDHLTHLRLRYTLHFDVVGSRSSKKARELGRTPPSSYRAAVAADAHSSHCVYAYTCVRASVYLRSAKAAPRHYISSQYGQ